MRGFSFACFTTVVLTTMACRLIRAGDREGDVTLTHLGIACGLLAFVLVGVCLKLYP